MNAAIFSIYDKKTKTYNRPFYEKNETVALRGFTTEVNRPNQNNTLYLFPEDYAMYKIGEYDDETGKLHAIEPTLICEASAIVSEKIAEKNQNTLTNV